MRPSAAAQAPIHPAPRALAHAADLRNTTVRPWTTPPLESKGSEEREPSFPIWFLYLLSISSDSCGHAASTAIFVEYAQLWEGLDDEVTTQEQGRGSLLFLVGGISVPTPLPSPPTRRPTTGRPLPRSRGFCSADSCPGGAGGPRLLPHHGRLPPPASHRLEFFSGGTALLALLPSLVRVSLRYTIK